MKKIEIIPSGKEPEINWEKKEKKEYVPQYNVWLAGSGTPVISITDVYKALGLKAGDKVEIPIIRKVEETPKIEEPKDVETEKKKVRFK